MQNHSSWNSLIHLFLAIRREFTRRSKSASAEMARKKDEAEKELEEHKEDQKAINAGKNFKKCCLMFMMKEKGEGMSSLSVVKVILT